MKLKNVETMVKANHLVSSNGDALKKKKGRRNRKIEQHEKKEKRKNTMININCVVNHRKDTNGDYDVDSLNEGSNIMKIDMISLKESTKSENAFVTKLINTIPEVIYFKSDNLNKMREEKHAKAHEKLKDIGLNGKAEKLSISVESKHVKLDPEQQKSLTELQLELETPNEKSPSTSHKNSVYLLKQRLQEKLATSRSSRKNVKEEIVKRKRLQKKMKVMTKKEKKKHTKEQGNTVKTEKEKPQPSLPSKPVYNEDGKMVFSKFDFSENGYEDNSRKKKGPAGKDYKALLKKLEHEKEKFAKLKETDEEKAKLVQEKNLWKMAIDKAAGTKVKQDEGLLKKALKKKEKRKKKTKKEWNERVEKVKEKQQYLQKKRERNIQARKEDKKKHKMKRGVKRGRLPPNAI